ncbi:MAG TPA: FG-GAP repeat protein [Mycobacteriales bacterium]|nr:FG-GAP repeat protein [Mycobacteriales bacterium]
MSDAAVAAPVRPVVLPSVVRRRALMGLVALACTALAAAGLPALLSSGSGAAESLAGGTGAASLSVTNPAQGLTASFGIGALTVRSQGARFTLGRPAVARGSQVHSLAPVQPRVSSGEVRYAYPGGVTETWQNESAGLEQSFVIARPPAGAGPLSIDMTAPATAVLNGAAVLLPGGLSYGSLRATDASGRVLRSWLALSHGTLRIKVSDHDAQYPVRIDPLVHKANVTASDGAVGDLFGTSVAVSGSTMVVGAPDHKVGLNSNEGAAYVFTDRSGHWKQVAELTPPAGIPSEEFGAAVAISGKTIAVSGWGAGSDAQGAVFVFSDSSGHWKQIGTLTASDAAPNDELGHYSIAMQGSTIVAGAPYHSVDSVSGQGAVYVFDEPSGGWHSMTQSAELTESHGAPDDYVGYSVSISGNTIAAGAPAPYHGNNHNAAIFVFTKSAGHWKVTGEMHQKNAALDNDIGSAVAISGHTIAAGASETGALYVFQPKGGKWKQTADLSYGGCDAGCLTYSYLGSAVAFDGSTILASADDISAKGDYLGAVAQYREISGHWREVARFLTGSGEHSTQNLFDESVAASGSTVVAGVYNSGDKGSAVVYKGHVTSEGLLIDQIGATTTGEGVVSVTCEEVHSTCRVTVGVHRAGTKKVMGHAKPKNIPATDVKTITVHFNKAFEHLLAKPKGVDVTFTVREYSHGKLKAHGSATVHFIPE